jgi:hypothetical protein
MPNKPSHRVYYVKDSKGEGKKGYWMEIRAAWPHKDGKGFDVVLDVLPLDGRMKLREEMEKEAPAQ